MEIRREPYLNQLIERKDNGMIKIVTGIRRCESLISLLNTLGVSADAVFCDVLDHSPNYMSSVLSEKLSVLPSASQKRILQVVELMIQQELEACNMQTQASTTAHL